MFFFLFCIINQNKFTGIKEFITFIEKNKPEAIIL